MMRVSPGPAKRVLDFDIENRPLSYWYDGQSTAEVTGIAWAFVDQPKKIEVALLQPHMTDAEWRESMTSMLTRFCEAYAQADVVTGHYIRMHDLPIINMQLIEMGLPILGPKETIDTKLDLVKFKDIPKTQEHLSDMLGVDAPKIQMSQMKWRRANRITVEGIPLAEERARGDVHQHMRLRRTLEERGLLRGSKVWRP